MRSTDLSEPREIQVGLPSTQHNDGLPESGMDCSAYQAGVTGPRCSLSSAQKRCINDIPCDCDHLWSTVFWRIGRCRAQKVVETDSPTVRGWTYWKAMGKVDGFPLSAPRLFVALV